MIKLVDLLKMSFPFVILILIGCDPVSELTKREVLATGQLYTQQFFSDTIDSLHNSFADDKMTLGQLRVLKRGVKDKFGSEQLILDEMTDDKIWKNRKYYGYVRHSKFTNTEKPVRILIAFDDTKNILRFEVTQIQEPAPTSYDNYILKTTLSPPFTGEWQVMAGGRSSMHNHHTISIPARFAIDFQKMVGGSSYANSGSRNEDYYSYNVKIFSPGKGIIVNVVNHMKENKIGEMPPSEPGNLIIIDHLNGEYSVLAHLKGESITVSVGDSIENGHYLGLCGNNGYSFGPHLHFHMQTSPIMLSGNGLPIRFSSYYSNNDYVDQGEPSWGETIRKGEVLD